MSSNNLGFKGGISLAFVSYPSAVLEMEVSPLWSFLFFFMLINLALSSICGGMQTFLAFIIDEKPSLKKYQTWILVGLCILFFCAGLPMVKLTTCFHEFFKYESTNFSTKYYITFVLIFANPQNWDKLPFVINKEFVFFFNWELLVFVDSYLEKSWKHVMSSIIVCQWRNITVYNVWQKSNCQSTIYLRFGNCSCGLGIWHWQVFY